MKRAATAHGLKYSDRAFERCWHFAILEIQASAWSAPGRRKSQAQLATDSTQRAEPVRERDDVAGASLVTPVPSETTASPRYTTTTLSPVPSAQALYEMAVRNMAIIPHVLVDAPSKEMEMIKECLALLKTVSDRQWSRGTLVPADSHDDADFPEVSRRCRLGELFVLLKGHDIRIAACSEIYYYPPGAVPRLSGQKFCFQLVVGFAPPRGEFDEETVSLPFDGGCDHTSPSEPIF